MNKTDNPEPRDDQSDEHDAAPRACLTSRQMADHVHGIWWARLNLRQRWHIRRCPRCGDEYAEVRGFLREEKALCSSASRKEDNSRTTNPTDTPSWALVCSALGVAVACIILTMVDFGTSQTTTPVPPVTTSGEPANESQRLAMQQMRDFLGQLRAKSVDWFNVRSRTAPDVQNEAVPNPVQLVESDPQPAEQPQLIALQKLRDFLDQMGTKSLAWLHSKSSPVPGVRPVQPRIYRVKESAVLSSIGMQHWTNLDKLRLPTQTVEYTYDQHGRRLTNSTAYASGAAFTTELDHYTDESQLATLMSWSAIQTEDTTPNSPTAAESPDQLFAHSGHGAADPIFPLDHGTALVAAEDAFRSVRLEWSAAPDSGGYDFEIYDSSTTVSLSEPLWCEQRLMPSSPLYHWRVRARRGLENPWSCSTCNGTSMASPHVAGAVALLWGNPAWTHGESLDSPPAWQIRRSLNSSLSWYRGSRMDSVFADSDFWGLTGMAVDVADPDADGPVYLRSFAFRTEEVGTVGDTMLGHGVSFQSWHALAPVPAASGSCDHKEIEDAMEDLSLGVQYNF